MLAKPSKCEAAFDDEEAEEDDAFVKQVALTVPTTDDPSLFVLTFRMWVLGILSYVRDPLLPEPVSLLPRRATLDLGRLRPDSGGATGSPHGFQDHKPSVLPGQALGIHTQPRSIQREGTRTQHHLRQSWGSDGLRHPRCHCAQGFL